MGNEARCTARHAGQSADGKALLETDDLRFRGDGLRFVVPYAGLTRVEARDGTLHLTGPFGEAELDLGPLAAKWADKIRNPKSRLDKLGLKPGQAIGVLGPIEQAFLDELAARGFTPRAGNDLDLLFAAANHLTELDLLAWKTRLKPNGGLWIIRPKGRPEISERDVMAAGHAAGLVDVKVARFSATHTAEKYVIPLSARG